MLYRAWEKGLNIVLALKSKEATLLLFLLSSLFCTLSPFIRSALRLIFNGALGAKEMSGLWIHTHRHTDTQGYTWAWERQLKRDKFIQRAWLTVTQEGPKCPLCPGAAQRLHTPHFSWRQAPKVQFDKMVFVPSLFVTLFCLSFSCFTALFVCFFQAGVE